MSDMGKQFLNDVRQRADEVIAAEHIGIDVKNLVKDLLQACLSFENAVIDNAGASSDMRLLKRKIDQTKAETKAAEAKFEAAKAHIIAITTELKTVGGETSAILKRLDGNPADPNHASATKIKAASQKMAEMVIKALQG